MEKTLKWFKPGDAIPDNAKFIQSKTFIINSYDDEASWALGPVEEYEERYLYEVQDIQEKAD